MVNISPFKGWRFNTDIISDLRKVIAPPYDVINDTDQYVYKVHRQQYIWEFHTLALLEHSITRKEISDRYRNE